MKKTYINPTTDVIEIEMNSLIATSVGFGEGGKGGGSATGRFLDDDEDDLLDIINQ